MFSDTPPQVRLAALRIVGIYAFFGAVWILVSDTIVGWLVSDHDTLTRVALFKGWLFVLLTSLILYKLIYSDNLKLAKATALLQGSEERFHTIYDSLNDAVFIHDAETGRILDVNETMSRLYGYSRDEVLTKGLYQVGTGEPPYSEVEALEWIHRCAQGVPQTFEWITATKYNQHLWVEVSMRPATIDGEKRIVAMVRDISARKQAEEQLAQQQAQLEELNHTLEKRVAEAVAELRQRDELLLQQSRHAAMGEMLNNIAHQWRQPLNNIAIYVQSMQLLKASGELTDEQIQSDVQSVMEIINYMSKTIDDFRIFFRNEKQKHPFSVRDAVEKALAFVAAQMQHYAISWQLDVRHEIIVNGYQAEYIQVVLNILNNAIDVLNHANRQERRVVVTVDGNEGQAVLSIADTGGGIAPEILPHIFEPYFSTKGPAEGTGIGLYMAKTIIEKHMSGSLSVRNLADGAEFIISLPTSADAP
ncbi:MAG: PAS domain-containing sensor histidine kinase [Geobacteraceae bacterium]|nr:PAS domain-containing sensor histidine kinase [Geobacteraceae bacterium]